MKKEKIANHAFVYIKPHVMKVRSLPHTLLFMFEERGCEVAGRLEPVSGEKALSAWIQSQGENFRRNEFSDPSFLGTLGASFSKKFKQIFNEPLEKVLSEKRIFMPLQAVEELKDSAKELLNAFREQAHHCHDGEEGEHHCHCHDGEEGEHHCHCHDGEAEEIPEIPPEELVLGIWATYGAEQITDDLYVCYYPLRDVYLVNGFYPALRASIAQPNSLQSFAFCVKLPSSWSDFFEIIAGDENPSGALEESIRGYIYDRREDIGVQLDLFDNLFYTSASVYETLRDVYLWLPAFSRRTDPLWNELKPYWPKSSGASKRMWKEFLALGDSPQKCSKFRKLSVKATARRVLRELGLDAAK